MLNYETEKKEEEISGNQFNHSILTSLDRVNWYFTIHSFARLIKLKTEI